MQLVSKWLAVVGVFVISANADLAYEQYSACPAGMKEDLSVPRTNPGLSGCPSETYEHRNKCCWFFGEGPCCAKSRQTCASCVPITEGCPEGHIEDLSIDRVEVEAKATCPEETFQQRNKCCWLTGPGSPCCMTQKKSCLTCKPATEGCPAGLIEDLSIARTTVDSSANCPSNTYALRNKCCWLTGPGSPCCMSQKKECLTCKPSNEGCPNGFLAQLGSSDKKVDTSAETCPANTYSERNKCCWLTGPGSPCCGPKSNCVSCKTALKGCPAGMVEDTAMARVALINETETCPSGMHKGGCCWRLGPGAPCCAKSGYQCISCKVSDNVPECPADYEEDTSVPRLQLAATENPVCPPNTVRGGCCWRLGPGAPCCAKSGYQCATCKPKESFETCPSGMKEDNTVGRIALGNVENPQCPAGTHRGGCCWKLGPGAPCCGPKSMYQCMRCVSNSGSSNVTEVPNSESNFPAVYVGVGAGAFVVLAAAGVIATRRFNRRVEDVIVDAKAVSNPRYGEA